MPYEMQELLSKCDAEDLKLVLRQIDTEQRLEPITTDRTVHPIRLSSQW